MPISRFSAHRLKTLGVVFLAIAFLIFLVGFGVYVPGQPAYWISYPVFMLIFAVAGTAMLVQSRTGNRGAKILGVALAVIALMLLTYDLRVTVPDAPRGTLSLIAVGIGVIAGVLLLAISGVIAFVAAGVAALLFLIAGVRNYNAPETVVVEAPDSNTPAPTVTPRAPAVPTGDRNRAATLGDVLDAEERIRNAVDREIDTRLSSFDDRLKSIDSKVDMLNANPAAVARATASVPVQQTAPAQQTQKPAAPTAQQPQTAAR
ncbi:MAG TPA: hypothetical protein VEC17_00570, partial [Candidatus Binatia bacterium]|nr:hypothetical protein [Candidatus Binatia bacterium]